MFRYLLDADRRVLRPLRPWERTEADATVFRSVVPLTVGALAPTTGPEHPDAKDRGPIALTRADAERVIAAAGPTPLRHFLAEVFTRTDLSTATPVATAGADIRVHLWADDSTWARLKAEAAERGVPMRALLRGVLLARVA